MIEFIVRPNASARGYSYWSSLLTCPRYARLRSEDDSQRTIIGGTGAGTLYHAFLELYHARERRKFDPTTVVFLHPDGLPVLDIDPSARNDAERCFFAYQNTVGTDEFGTVLGAELVFPNDCHRGNPAIGERMIAQTVDDAQRDVRFGSGLPDFTGIIDLVTDIDADQADYLNRKWNLDLAPGIYITDHKLYAARGTYLRDEMERSLQFTGYQLAWYTLTGEYPRGALVNLAFKLKAPDFWLLQIPSIEDAPEQRLAWEAFAAQAVFLNQHNYDACNPNACFGKFGKPCQYLVSGECMRF